MPSGWWCHGNYRHFVLQALTILNTWKLSLHHSGCSMYIARFVLKVNSWPRVYKMVLSRVNSVSQSPLKGRCGLSKSQINSQSTPNSGRYRSLSSLASFANSFYQQPRQWCWHQQKSLGLQCPFLPWRPLLWATLPIKVSFRHQWCYFEGLRRPLSHVFAGDLDRLHASQGALRLSFLPCISKISMNYSFLYFARAAGGAFFFDFFGVPLAVGLSPSHPTFVGRARAPFP